jgi:biopolymer transport protein ExbD
MAQKRRFFDVWIIETNQVYKEVPYTVVADWVEQGRLLEDDKLKPSGTAEWFRLGGYPAFAAYLPKTEPYRAEDHAEALEPVEGGFRWKRAPDEEDEEVDMIPLIDVSLVLLVFFIMTTTGAFFLNIQTPATNYATMTSDPELLWIGIDYQDENPVYSIGFGENQNPPPENRDILAREQLVRRLDEILAELEAEHKTPVEVQIKAHEKLPAGHVRRMRVELGKPQRKDKIAKVWAGVRDKVY